MEDLMVESSMTIKKLRIKFKAIILDLDDTVLGFLQALVHQYNMRHNTSLSHNDIKTWDFDDLDITDKKGNRIVGKDLRDLFVLLEENGMYAALEPLEYSKRFLSSLKEEGYKIIFITARNEKHRIATEYNLNKYELPYDELYFEKDKIKRIKSLSRKYHIVMFADDKASTVKAVAENCKVDNVVLIDKAHNRSEEFDEDLEIVRAADLMDCSKLIPSIKSFI
jgi:uncharacterized HAD superfamily protein